MLICPDRLDSLTEQAFKVVRLIPSALLRSSETKGNRGYLNYKASRFDMPRTARAPRFDGHIFLIPNRFTEPSVFMGRDMACSIR
jgi:hypothetical protein